MDDQKSTIRAYHSGDLHIKKSQLPKIKTGIIVAELLIILMLLVSPNSPVRRSSSLTSQDQTNLNFVARNQNSNQVSGLNPQYNTPFHPIYSPTPTPYPNVTLSPTPFPSPTPTKNSCNNIGGSCANSLGVTSSGRSCSNYQPQFNSNCANPYPYCFSNCGVPSPTPSPVYPTSTQNSCNSIGGSCANSNGVTSSGRSCTSYKPQFNSSCSGNYGYCYTGCAVPSATPTIHPTPQGQLPVFTLTPSPYPNLTLSPTPAGQVHVVSLTVDGKSLDVAHLGSSIHLSLPGTAGQRQTISVPIEIHYSNGRVFKTALNFLYDPALNNPVPTTDQSCNAIGGSCAASNGITALGRKCTTYQANYSASCAATSQVFPYCYTGCEVPTATPTPGRLYTPTPTPYPHVTLSPTPFPTPTSTQNSCNSIGGSCANSAGTTSSGRSCTNYQPQFNSNCSNPYPYCYTNCTVPSPTPSNDCASINGRCATSDGLTSDNYKCDVYQGSYSSSCAQAAAGGVYPYCWTSCHPR